MVLALGDWEIPLGPFLFMTHLLSHNCIVLTSTLRVKSYKYRTKGCGMRPMVRLREVRERATLTQEELARRSGVGRATIAGLETGRRRAQPKTAHKLAEALGVELTELYGKSRQLDSPFVGPLTTIFERTHDGWWVVSVPEIPGAHSQGRSRDEAREMIQDAVRLLLEVRREDAEREVEGREVIKEPLAL